MSDDDARDAHLLETGRIDRLLATYELVILARCIKGTKSPHDGQDVAQDVMFRLFREFEAGKRYEGIPYRVVVHQVTKWTLADFHAGRRTDVPLPDELDERLVVRVAAGLEAEHRGRVARDLVVVDEELAGGLRVEVDEPGGVGGSTRVFEHG